MMNQPGAGPYYGNDYEILGLVLGRAYNMNPAALMKQKIWDPLGMQSAFMSYLNPGDPRLDRVLDTYIVGPPAAAYTNPLYPGAQEPAELPPGVGKFESELPDDSVFTEQNRLDCPLCCDAWGERFGDPQSGNGVGCRSRRWTVCEEEAVQLQRSKEPPGKKHVWNA